MNIHPTHSETYWVVVLVGTMVKRCENDLLDQSGRKKECIFMKVAAGGDAEPAVVFWRSCVGTCVYIMHCSHFRCNRLVKHFE